MKISKEGFKIITVSGILCLALWFLLFYMLKANDVMWLLIALGVLLSVFWFLLLTPLQPRRAGRFPPLRSL